METKKYELPKEFATKWVEALRGGKYNKIICAYKRGECYCAVGLGYKVNGYQFDGSMLVDEPNVDFIYHDNKSLWNRITCLNDNEGKSFPEIADWIEQNVNFI